MLRFVILVAGWSADWMRLSRAERQNWQWYQISSGTVFGFLPVKFHMNGCFRCTQSLLALTGQSRRLVNLPAIGKPTQFITILDIAPIGPSTFTT
jgi:hypothetical protein